jgi:hypothetical protein
LVGVKVPTSANVPHKLAVRDVETLLKWANSARSPAQTQVLLRRAEQCAAREGFALAERYDVEPLLRRLGEKPKVVDGRFAPDPAGLEVLAWFAWVRCGRCGSPGVVEAFPPAQRLPEDQVCFRCLGCAYAASGAGIRFGHVTVSGRVRCSKCGQWVSAADDLELNGTLVDSLTESCAVCGNRVSVPVIAERHTSGPPREATFGLPLLLATTLSQGTLFAYNRYHLEQLQCYVSARVRDESNNSASSWSSRLPTWIKAAKNRDRILRALDNLRELADSSGLR